MECEKKDERWAKEHKGKKIDWTEKEWKRRKVVLPEGELKSSHKIEILGRSEGGCIPYALRSKCHRSFGFIKFSVLTSISRKKDDIFNHALMQSKGPFTLAS